MIQLLPVRCRSQRAERVKHAERMTPLQKLVDVPSVQRASDDEHDVVNHVCVPAARSQARPPRAMTPSVSPSAEQHTRNARHVFQELAKRLNGIAPEVVELVNEHLCRLVRDGGGGDGKRFVGEEVAIIRRGQLCPEVFAY